MSQYKEFQGKSLDEAIREACEYYGVPREKLEIEIISDAKSGIFGLVGAKKASIRAARVQFEGLSSLLESDGDEKEPSKPDPRNAARQEARAGRQETRPDTNSGSRSEARQNARSDAWPAQKQRTDADSRNSEKSAVPQASGGPDRLNARRGQTAGRESRPPRDKALGSTPADASKTPPTQAKSARSQAEQRPANPQPDPGRGAAPDSGRKEPRPAKRPLRNSPGKSDSRQDRPGGKDPGLSGRESGELAAEDDFSLLKDMSPEALFEQGREELPELDLESCDRELLSSTVREVLLSLVGPIVGKVPCEVEISGRRVRATLDCGEVSGLLVGKEGYTLASVQYLAARIIARRLGGALRLHIDTGNYRERQDDRLKDLALSLAERVKENGRPQSTRPLSAYQRRIVHLALENDPLVSTRSKGEGAQRRVIIYPDNGEKPASRGSAMRGTRAGGRQSEAARSAPEAGPDGGREGIGGQNGPEGGTGGPDGPGGNTGLDRPEGVAGPDLNEIVRE